MSTKRATALLLGAVLATAPSMAGAEDEKLDLEQEYVPEEGPDQQQRQGVDWRLNTGATVSLNDNRNVIGQQEGSTFLFGYKFDSGLDYRDAGHELRNSLGAAASITITPIIDDVIKAQDNLDYETIYLYHVLSWFGPFLDVKLSTTTMPGMDYRPELTTYSITDPDGAQSRLVAERLRLTESFRPLRLKESAGAFFQPVSEEPYALEFRLGAGARETFAEDQRALDDDKDTPEVEVKVLEDVHQFGAEAVAEFWGTLYEKKVTYKLGAEVMIPFVNNQRDDDDRSAFDLTNAEFRAALSFKLVEWASLDYQFKAVREAQLIEEFQLQNNLLFTFGLATGTEKKDEKKEEK